MQEWLRSLPDCLLMSRLYPQWIAVAKLIEPLHQHQMHQLQLQQQQQQELAVDHPNDDEATTTTTTNSAAADIESRTTSLRPSRSPLTDNGQPLDRARSCSTLMMSESSINKMNLGGNSDDSSSLSTMTTTPKTAAPDSAITGPSGAPTMSAFDLSERHSECLRIVGQLLDALNESNLILLRSFICILWHIANNSEHNKMSANNLGVCVGQSLLNDEHQTSSPSFHSTSTFNGSKLMTSTFTKRHRRTRSQCLLSSTLSLTGVGGISSSNGSGSPPGRQLSGAYFDSTGAQVSSGAYFRNVNPRVRIPLKLHDLN